MRMSMQRNTSAEKTVVISTHKFSVLIALFLVLISGCAGKKGSRIVVGVSLPTQREERWVRDKQTIVAEAKARGIDLRLQVTDNDAHKQIAQCENLLSQGIDVLILAPHDASSASVIVERAVKSGVKVISYDRLVVDSFEDFYYLSFDNVRVGELQGEYITRLVPEGNYVILSGSPTDNNSKLFREGVMKYITPLVENGSINVVMDQWVKDWQPAEAQKLLEQALTATSNNIDAVLAPNDGTAGGCIQALAAQNLAGKVVVTGMDAELAAAIRILDGTQSMTIYKDTRKLGKRAVDLAIDLAEGKTIDTGGVTVFNNKRYIPAILLPPFIVTRDNLNEVLIDSGYLVREQVYKKK